MPELTQYNELLQHVNKAKSKIEDNLQHISSTKVQQLKQAILNKDFKADIILSTDFEICAFKLFHQKEITFNSLMTLLLLNMAKEDAQSQQLEYKFDFSTSTPFQNELRRVFEKTYENYSLFFNPSRMNNLMEDIFLNPISISPTKLDQIIASLVLMVPYLHLDENSEVIANRVRVTEFGGMGKHILCVPSYHSIVAYYDCLKLNHVKPMPTFGRISIETLSKYNKDNRHPLAVFSSLVKSNYAKVHDSIHYKLFIFLHDLYHLTAKNSILHEHWTFTQQIIIELEKVLNKTEEAQKIPSFSFRKNGEIISDIKSLIFGLNDFDYSTFDDRVRARAGTHLTSNYVQKIIPREGLFNEFITGHFISTVIYDSIRLIITYPNGTQASFGKENASSINITLLSQSIANKTYSEADIPTTHLIKAATPSRHKAIHSIS